MMVSLSIYDETLSRVAEIGTFVSLIWDEKYNDIGKFQLEMQQTSQAANIIKPKRFVGSTGKKTLMYITAVESANKKIIATGFPAVRLLKDRVSVKEIKNENVETALRGLVSEMNPFPFVSLGEISGISAVFSNQISDKSLLEYCTEMCQQTNCGFIMRHDKQNKKLLFEVYKPEENKALRFSPDYGNLSDESYSVSIGNFKNVAVVAGQGISESRVTVVVGDTETTGLNRNELYCDARFLQQTTDESDADYKKRLENYGFEKLAEQINIEKISFSINPEDFGKKYNLGDVITCMLPTIGVKLKTRITGFSETIQRNKTKFEIDVGTPISIKGV